MALGMALWCGAKHYSVWDVKKRGNYSLNLFLKALGDAPTSRWAYCVK